MCYGVILNAELKRLFKRAQTSEDRAERLGDIGVHLVVCSYQQEVQNVATAPVHRIHIR
jgi:hypothetical protein